MLRNFILLKSTSKRHVNSYMMNLIICARSPKNLFTSFEEKSIVAQGEIMSTNMVVNYLQENGVKAVLLNALDFMRTDKNGEPDLQTIKESYLKS